MGKYRACVIGSGPNGLAAAIVLAQRGLGVDVFEAEAQAGGGARTMELTLPGFLHDFGSAVHPMAAGSPFFSSLPLRDYGLGWTHSPAALAHPLDDGTTVMLERDLADAERALGVDGKGWRNLFEPFVDRWSEFSEEVLAPIHLPLRHPLLLGRFGLSGLWSAKTLAGKFRSERTKALFAGLASHSFLSLDERLSGAFGMVLGVAAHAVGWPIPRGGAQSITNALCGYFVKLGGTIRTSRRIEKWSELKDYNLTLCDLTPQQLLGLGRERFSATFTNLLGRYRYGPAAFKVDYALSSPIPWKAEQCLRAATVHLGGTFAEIAASEKAMSQGEHAERPFVLLAQPSLFDKTRAPEGKHIAWAYCHVPNGSSFDMLPRIEAQLERFAPGFRDCVLKRRVFSPSALEQMDANLIGGDISGGAMDVGQMLFRPTWRGYGTSAKDVYLCSSSTPPGGGVHGMCGYHAARMAVGRMKFLVNRKS
ncbi:MAG: phytoene desaturase family protein [Terriglobales bacterium]